MEARKTKIFTYLGFAKKSGNLCIGANSLARLKKRAYLLISCKTATDNARKDAENLPKRSVVRFIRAENSRLKNWRLKTSVRP